MQRFIRCYYTARQSYYDILGLQKTATPEEIKNAFYNLSKKYHPDIAGSNAVATKKFVAIKVAYDILKDTDKRQEYDDRMSKALRTSSMGYSASYRDNFNQQSPHQQPITFKASRVGHFFNPSKELERETRNQKFWWIFGGSVLLIIIGNMLYVSFVMNRKKR